MQEHVYDFADSPMSEVKTWVLTNPHGTKLHHSSEMLEVDPEVFIENIKERQFNYTAGYENIESHKWELKNFTRFTPSGGSLRSLIVLNYVPCYPEELKRWQG